MVNTPYARKEHLKCLQRKYLDLRKDLTRILLAEVTLIVSSPFLYQLITLLQLHKEPALGEYLLVSVFAFVFFAFVFTYPLIVYMYLYDKAGRLYLYELGALYVQKDIEELKQLIPPRNYDRREMEEKSKEIAKTLLYTELELTAVKLFLEKAGMVRKIGEKFAVQWPSQASWETR